MVKFCKGLYLYNMTIFNFPFLKVEVFAMSYRMKLFQDELARCIQRLHNEGWLPNEEMGEASVRDTESGNVTISIKPGTIGVTDPAAYLGSDMPIVDRDGNYITHHAPCHENLPLHLAIYKARPDVSAIIHVYPLWTTMFTNRKRGLPFVLAEQLEASCNVQCVQSPPALTAEYFAGVIRPWAIRAASSCTTAAFSVSATTSTMSSTMLHGWIPWQKRSLWRNSSAK